MRNEIIKGFTFPDNYMLHELEASFMFEETPDQRAAIHAVKKDMERSTPMDRLVCGDVGFGKTEVAIRAAFKAAADGKQVAVWCRQPFCPCSTTAVSRGACVIFRSPWTTSTGSDR